MAEDILVRKHLVALATTTTDAERIHRMVQHLQPNELKLLLLAEFCRYLPDETIARVAGIQRKRVQRIKDNARELLREVDFLKKDGNGGARG